MEPVGSAEHIRGKNPDTPFSTTVTLDLRPIRILTRWSDEILSSRGGHDKWSQAPRGNTLFLGQVDGPVSHNNFWDRAGAQPTRDTSSNTYDGGGEHVPETPPDVHRETATKN